MRRRDEGLESSGRNASEKKEGKAGRLVERLLSWKEDLGALAALRRGWGKEPGTAPEMFPYVASFDDSRWEGEVVYIVAGLFGMWPQHDPSSGSFGASMRRLVEPEEDVQGTSVEKRFLSLLDADAGELYQALPRMVGLLKAKEVPLNYLLLTRHLFHWKDEGIHNVRRRWAVDFWRRPFTRSVETTKED